MLPKDNGSNVRDFRSSAIEGLPTEHRTELEELLHHLETGHGCLAAGQYVQAITQDAVNEAQKVANRNAVHGPSGEPIQTGPIVVKVGEILQEEKHAKKLKDFHTAHWHHPARIDDPEPLHRF